MTIRELPEMIAREDTICRLRPLLALLVPCLVLACGSSSPSQPDDDNNPPPPPPPDPVVAHIDGPTLFERPVGDDTPVTATYSAASSTGPIVSYKWFAAGQQFAEGVTAERTLYDSGSYWTRLRVEGDEGQSHEVSHSTVVGTDLMRGGPVLGFFTYNRTDSLAVAYMLPAGTEVAIGLKVPRGAFGNGGGWDPDHARLVFTYDDDIWVANRDGTGLTKIIDTDHVAWHPDWSPTGEWITYNDDSHDGVGPPDLLYVARPDGTDVTLVGSDPTDWNFHVGHPSWDPTGTRIAAKGRWEVAPGDTKRRIVIFSDLWGTPTRQVLHTEEQIEAAFGSPTQFDVNEGSNGVAWSPDGEWIAYNAIVVELPTRTEQKLCLSRADGSGGIIVLATGSVKESFPTNPAWSPDGQTIFFEQHVGSVGHIFSIPASGGTATDLSAITNTGADDTSPFF